MDVHIPLYKKRPITELSMMGCFFTLYKILYFSISSKILLSAVHSLKYIPLRISSVAA